MLTSLFVMAPLENLFLLASYEPSTEKLTSSRLKWMSLTMYFVLLNFFYVACVYRLGGWPDRRAKLSARFYDVDHNSTIQKVSFSALHGVLVR